MKRETIPVAVVVPVLNESASIGDLLAGLGRQTVRPAEIVFVDAGSSDGTADSIQDWWCRNGWSETTLQVINSPGSFPGAGRNRGVAAASQQWVAFIDGGMVPDSHWLERLYAVVDRQDRPGVFGICEFSAMRPVALAICAVSNGYRARHPVIPASMFKRSVLLDMRFREDLRTAEDMLWVAEYVARYGRREICTTALVYYLDFPVSLGAAFRKWRTSEYNSVLAGVRRTQHYVYLSVAIGFLALPLASHGMAVFLAGTYAILRGIVDPVRRSGKASGWSYSQPAFWLAPVVAATIDAAKIVGIVAAYRDLALRRIAKPRAGPNAGGATRQAFQAVPLANVDTRVVNNFGEEWTRFPQDGLVDAEWNAIFSDYFHLFPWATLPKTVVGADIGCGSGRWAAVVAPRVGQLHCVDASSAALDVAKTNLIKFQNVVFHVADVGHLPFSENELDFAYSLGVLHHVPDTEAALKSIARILKPDGVFLVYLYYALENRPVWFRSIWLMSNAFRWTICRLPKIPRFLICDAIALSVYWPLARFARAMARSGFDVRSLPLSYYRDKSLYVMRTDALDRFGTKLEKRYRKQEIADMLTASGFTNVEFSARAPYWCAVAYKDRADASV